MTLRIVFVHPLLPGDVLGIQQWILNPFYALDPDILALGLQQLALELQILASWRWQTLGDLIHCLIKLLQNLLILFRAH